MSAPDKYERDDEEVETPAAALWDKEDNKRFVETVKSGTRQHDVSRFMERTVRK